VPCENPAEHLTLVTTSAASFFKLSGVLHWDTVAARNLDSKTIPHPNWIKAAPAGWCEDCDYERLHTNGRFPGAEKDIGLHPLLRKFGYGLDEDYEMSDRLLTLARAPAQRATKVQVPFCDGKYRCLTCMPEGQYFPLSRQQCPHVNTLPKWEHGMFIHFKTLYNERAKHPFESQHPELFERAIMRCCGMCSKTLKVKK
jgi:hypothetical protein